LDRPYQLSHAEGEGDWCNLTERHCPHIQQDPIYRTDVFDCQTLVQNILAFIRAKNINDYEKNILQIAYGAAGEATESIHFYNRNNFTSGDFNPVNQRTGLLVDVTAQGVFAHHTQQTQARIDRSVWFAKQASIGNINKNVRVIQSRDGNEMVKRFSHQYPNAFHVFKPELVTIRYIPKEYLIKSIKNPDGKISYQPDQHLIQQLPTPSVIEIVRNVKKWRVHNIPIKDLIGTELNVSHMGLLYHQHFATHALIYQKIICANEGNQKICNVIPILCEQANGCDETLFLHATDAYPQGYYYFKDAQNHYYCRAQKPPPGIRYTTCNRVMALPIGDYLTAYQYGKYIYMIRPSIS